MSDPAVPLDGPPLDGPPLDGPPLDGPPLDGPQSNRAPSDRLPSSRLLSPRLRDLGEDDLAWLAQQERVIFGPAAWSEGLIREDWRYGTNRYRGIEVDGDLAGYAIYGFEGDAFHLMNLAVTPEHRREGLAKVLMDDFLAEADTFGTPDAWLEVAVDNEAARGLYEAYGFDVVRVRRKYYQPGDIDALVMRRVLDGYRPAIALS